MVNRRGEKTVTDERGQALTFEGVIAGILILAAIGFALQVTAVTPLSPSTSSQHVENQLQSSGTGVLASTAENGSLHEAVLYWDVEEEQFHGAGESAHYRSGPPNTVFGNELDRSLGFRNVAYNVFVHYQTAEEETETQQMIEQGLPSDHAVSFSRTVTIVDEDRLVNEDGTPGERVTETDFYIPDASLENDDVYNVVQVEVIAWRI